MAVFFWLSLRIDHRGFTITSDTNISVEQLLENHTRTLYTLILHNTLYNTTQTHPDDAPVDACYIWFPLLEHTPFLKLCYNPELF